MIQEVEFLTDWEWQTVTGWYSIKDFINSWTCKLLLGWNNWYEINLSESKNDIRIQYDSVQISYRIGHFKLTIQYPILIEI